MSQPVEILPYNQQRPRRWRAWRKWLLIALLITAAMFIPRFLPPYSTSGWRSCDLCGRRETIHSSLYGLAKSTVPSPAGPLEQWFARNGTPCAHRWHEYITEENYLYQGVGYEIHVGPSPGYLLNTTMRMYSLTDDDIREFLRIVQSGRHEEMLEWTITISKSRPCVPTTAPAVPSPRPE